ncbi:MAG: hypothetical protein ACON5J_19020 [Rubripirellula sp.]
MADKTVSYGIEFLFSGGDSSKALKGISSASKGLEKDIERLRKQETMYEKAEKALARQLKLGKITKEEHITLSKRQAQAYRKITGDSSKLAKIYDKERRALEKKNKAQEIANAGLGRLGISAGAIGGPAGLALGAGAVGLAGLGAFANSQFNSQRETERNAELLGLGARELEGVTYAMSKLAAVSKDEAVDGLMDIRERLGEIADDVDGSLGKAARAIGLDANRLKGLSVDKQISGIVSSLAKLDTEARLFRSRELFGDSAALMLTGAAGDQQKFQDLQATGEKNAVLLDKATMDSMAQFKEATDNLSTSLAQVLLPAVEKMAKVAGLFADGERDLNDINSLREYINTMENKAISAGMALPAAPNAPQTLPQRFLGEEGNTRTDPSGNNKFYGRSFGEATDAYFDNLYGGGNLNRSYMAELRQRINVLESMGLGDPLKADDESKGNDAPMKPPAYDMSSVDSLIDRENRIDDVNSSKDAYMLAGYSERQAAVYAEMSKVRDEAMEAAREAGASEKEILEINDKYVTVAELRVARIQREEAAAKAETERAKKAREDYAKSVKAARAAYEADVNRVAQIRDEREAIMAGHEAKIQEQYDRSMAMAEGPALKGRNAFTGGSVEEFQFISDMISQKEKDDTVSKAEALAQEQRQRLADMKKQSDDQIEDKLQELRNGLESKLDSLISAINNKEL